ncbi:MAG: hypothetical protein IJ668_05740 [Selenomonadaceae bacterium]|nr:hypothetical protein [Selenomonadaceae bacterium]MBR1579982.1 hypothetical protein [Selenomonadaceae bacterium]
MDRNQIQAALDRCFGMMTDPEKFYVIQPYGIGDLIINGALVHALLAKLNRKTATLIVQERFRGLKLAFDGVGEIKYLSHTVLYFVADFLKSIKQTFGSNFMLASPPADWVQPPDLNALEMCKQMFGLPLDAVFAPSCEGDHRRCKVTVRSKLFPR